MQFKGLTRKLITVCAFHFPFPTKSEIKTKEISSMVNIEKVSFWLQGLKPFNFRVILTSE